MSEVPRNHPRYQSLMLRYRLVEGFRNGLVAEAGLLAHGRGEAFDYLLGERTHDFAHQAIAAASALLLTARHPVFSINGNSASLAGPELVELARTQENLVFEVNLFYHSAERSRRIADHLRNLGLSNVLESATPDAHDLPQIEHARRRMHPEGIARADVVLVALEDGDRCKALVESGRRVIAVDLNPMSRSAQVSHVSIVDELTRALPVLREALRNDQTLSVDALHARIASYDNLSILNAAEAAIRSGN